MTVLLFQFGFGEEQLQLQLQLQFSVCIFRSLHSQFHVRRVDVNFSFSSLSTTKQDVMEDWDVVIRLFELSHTWRNWSA